MSTERNGPAQYSDAWYQQIRDEQIRNGEERELQIWQSIERLKEVERSVRQIGGKVERIGEQITEMGARVDRAAGRVPEQTMDLFARAMPMWVFTGVASYLGWKYIGAWTILFTSALPLVLWWWEERKKKAGK